MKLREQILIESEPKTSLNFDRKSLPELKHKAFREKPESQIFAKRAHPINVARVSPLTDVSD